MNIHFEFGHICPECAAERKAAWQENNKDLLIQPGNFCLLDFMEEGKHEHMWVLVMSIAYVGGKKYYHGILRNDPVLLRNVADLDRVEFTHDEIEDVLNHEEQLLYDQNPL